MNKTAIYLAIVAGFAITGCVQKNTEQASKAVTSDHQAESVITQPDKSKSQDIIPAMLARSVKIKLEQPRICQQEQDINEFVCTNAEAIGLKSNIDWIDQIIDQEIREDFVDYLAVASTEQKQLNTTKVEGSRNWSQSVSYQFHGQFGQYVQIEKTSADYSGGAHGMAYFNAYIFDLKNKKRVTLNDIVVSGKQTALREALWQVYLNWCTDNDMQPFIDKKDFTISENFFIQPNGSMSFEYQIYELAPYVTGPVSLELYETDGLIQTDFLPQVPNFQQEY